MHIGRSGVVVSQRRGGAADVDTPGSAGLNQPVIWADAPRGPLGL